MARAVIRLDQAELSCFHANYIYMWKKLNTAPYYVSGFGESPSWIRSPELLPSYVNLSKCMNPDYVPSVNLVNKIVHFYNANIAPSVDTYTFLHETLEMNDRNRTALSCTSQQPYCGVYYGYCFSEDDSGQYIHGALLKIFESDGELRAHLISELNADEDLQNPQLRKLLDSGNISDRFNSFKGSLPLSKSFMTLFTGSGKVSPGVVLLQLRRADCDGVYLSLQLPVGKDMGDKYIGGLGMAFIVTADRTFQLYRFGFERADHKELRPVLLDDPKLKGLLSLNKCSSERLIMAPSDNSSWINFIVQNR